uniref:Uncharacterized protein n=1 Tax=Anguilla anguilla TaxID=7936 RepID=A0A0E9RFN3_ANGAN
MEILRYWRAQLSDVTANFLFYLFLFFYFTILRHGYTR